jgi:hypothetical protein
MGEKWAGSLLPMGGDVGRLTSPPCLHSTVIGVSVGLLLFSASSKVLAGTLLPAKGSADFSQAGPVLPIWSAHFSLRGGPLLPQAGRSGPLGTHTKKASPLE